MEIHLRDGSVLHGRLADGSVLLASVRGEIPIRLDEVEEILIADRYEPNLGERTTRLIRGLADGDYGTRERSTHELEELGGLVLPELRQALSTEDPEVRFRCRAILGRLEALGVEEIRKQDRVRTSEATRVGLLRLDAFRIEVEGKGIEIPRQEIERIRRHVAGPPPVSVRLEAGGPFVETGRIARAGEPIEVRLFGRIFHPGAGRSIDPTAPSANGVALRGRIGEEGEEFGIDGGEAVIPPASGPLYLRLAGESIEGTLQCKVSTASDSDLPCTARRLAPSAFGGRFATIDFDRSPNGIPVRPGEDVETLYAPLGALLDTEVASSYLAADAYTVASPSRGNSAANREPRWTGDVIVRFIVPGSFRPSTRSGEPAGVHRFGAYVAAVRKGGTGLEAFDRRGRSIGRVLAEKSGTDFLGISSRTPIYSVRIFDVPSIDPNFAIDDLRFDIPRRVSTPAFSVRLRDGQTLSGRPLEWRDGSLVLRADRLDETIVLGETRIDSITFSSGTAFPTPDRPRWGSITTTTGDRISGIIDSWEDGVVAIFPWGGDPIRLREGSIRTVDLHRGSKPASPGGEGEPGAVRIFRRGGKVAAGSSLRLSDRWGRPVFICVDEDGGREIVPLGEIDRIALASPLPEASPRPPAAVRMASGDLMTGSILEVGERRVHIRTPWADRVTLYRSSIDRVEFFPD